MSTKTSPKTITLLGWNSKKQVRKLHPKTHHIEFGTIVCKDAEGNVVQTISLKRFQIGMIACGCLREANANVHIRGGQCIVD